MDSLPKIIAVDANVLVCLCEKKGDRKEKVGHLIAQLDKLKGKVVLPTPSIAEFLVHADQASLEMLEALQRRSSVFVASFDLAAAYENSQMDAAALGRNNKRDGSKEPWQKVKVDRQIVAIAKAQGAKLIISDDDGVRTSAARVGIKAQKIDELSLPDSARQTKLPIEDPEQPS